jgi:hypothetical protein
MTAFGRHLHDDLGLWYVLDGDVIHAQGGDAKRGPYDSNRDNDRRSYISDVVEAIRADENGQIDEWSPWILRETDIDRDIPAFSAVKRNDPGGLILEGIGDDGTRQLFLPKIESAVFREEEHRNAQRSVSWIHDGDFDRHGASDGDGWDRRIDLDDGFTWLRPIDFGVAAHDGHQRIV